jgi:FixJ family two-component response regulator
VVSQAAVTMPPQLVVVVEDDLPTLKALGRVLRAGGFETAPYSSAEDFLVSPPADVPLCLVLDVRLGGMSGLELQQRLRSMGSTVPIIVMSGFHDAQARDEAFRMGCAGFLDKHADADALLDMIRSL